MNIITNKEVFSEENQAKLPKKAESRRGRPRKMPIPPVLPNIASDTSLGTPVTSNAVAPTTTNGSSNNTADPGERKTVFYQASRPRIIHPRPDIPRANGEPTIRPRYTPRPVAGGRFSSPSVAPSPVQPGRIGRFQTPRRRPDRRQYPQDGAGSFIQPNGSQTTLSQPVAPRTTSTEQVKIIPLGGLEEIGKNMTLIEYGRDIIIVDMGFLFPDSDMLGVDYIIPDVSYLDDKKDRIRGVVITHGHLDHIGAIPYLIQRLGFPPIYGTSITIGMVKQRLEEFNLLGRNKLITIEPEKDVLQLGSFRVSTFRLTHNVPGAVGLEIETPNGRLVYCTDWKFDYNPADGQQVDFRTLAAVGSRGVDLLLSDSTNADKPGHTISEKVVEASLSQAVEEAKGRVIIAMFSTMLARIQQTLNVAYRNNRKVLILGRSMQQNVEMAINLKAMVVPPNTMISEREVNRFPDEKVLVISTGSQGEDRAALSRMANGEHRIIKIHKGDTVIISASPIPGNERSVSGVMDMLYKAGASVIYNKILDVHSSGHAYQDDLKLMLALMKPKYFIPLHGERSRLILHGKLAEEVGVAPENIIIGDNGLILEMDNTGKVMPTDNHVPAGYVMVDGLGVGDVGNIVLRDRQAMAKEGVFMIVSVYDGKNHHFLNSPDIISRGFIYMR
ncbi:RNase J family beta-CASP ribonuclease [Patescibacteria group bacterium]|nr:RNase J family beta-CASP ribonuclease [Patescibacteria group bacterium]